MEQVRDDWLISVQMSIPLISCLFLLWQILVLVHVDVGLLAFSVKILTKEVKNRRDALMWVVLAIALELICVLSEYTFEHVGCDNTSILIPHAAQSLSVGHHEAPIRSKRVLHFKLCDVAELLIKEKLG